jgi:hypothetical protein
MRATPAQPLAHWRHVASGNSAHPLCGASAMPMLTCSAISILHSIAQRPAAATRSVSSMQIEQFVTDEGFQRREGYGQALIKTLRNMEAYQLCIGALSELKDW